MTGGMLATQERGHGGHRDTNPLQCRAEVREGPARNTQRSHGPSEQKRTVVVEEVRNELDVREDHSPAAVSVEFEPVQGSPAKNMTTGSTTHAPSKMTSAKSKAKALK